MSDFGTEIGNRSLSMAEKFMDALLQLVNKVFENARERTTAVGYINNQGLENAGVRLAVAEINMKEQDFKELASRCKREGLLITGVEDIRARDLNGVKTLIVKCRQDDLPRLGSLIDLMNDEKRISAINQEIAAIQSKNGRLGGDDVLVIGELEKQAEQIRYGHSGRLNEEQARSVFERAAKGQSTDGVTFEAAMDRWTGGRIDAGMEYYLADAGDPDNYIACYSQNDMFHNTEYIKTSYQVHSGGKVVYSTDDRRFEGRPGDYWGVEKAAMRDAGNFGNLVFKFYSAGELNQYREQYRTLSANLEGLQAGNESRDYQAIIKELNNQADKMPVLAGEAGRPDHIQAAESAVISRQIANYSEISRLESEVAIARTYVLTADQGTPGYHAAENDFKRVDHQYQNALQTEKGLIGERQAINAVQSGQMVRGLFTSEQGERKPGSEKQHNEHRSAPGTMADYKHEIKTMKEERISGSGSKAIDALSQSNILVNTNSR